MTRTRRFLCLLGCLPPLLPADEPAPDRFAYDHTAPFHLQEVHRETRGDALLRDITFVTHDRPVRAWLVTPAQASASGAAILYVHWLGEPETTNRTQFLAEAVTLAGRGVVSLLVDAMWAEPDWYNNRVPENDVADAVHQVIALRRAMDLLLAQPGVDPARVAFVGHDFGAMYGILAAAQDRRARTYVLMAATPHFIDWFLFARQPRDPAAYRAAIAPLDPVNAVGRLAPAPVLFQFASRDFYITAEEAAEFYAAAGPRKVMATYDADHALHPPQVAADRMAWLERELGLP